jgi:transposase-like protein
MAKKRHTPEQIIHLLRQAEVELADGRSVPQVCRKLGVTEQTYYRWRREYGGVRTDQAKRLKELERENDRAKRLLAEAELDKAILREVAAGNFLARRGGRRRSSTSRTPSDGTGSPSAGRAASAASPGPPNEESQASRTTSRPCSTGWCNWPPGTRGTGTGG